MPSSSGDRVGASGKLRRFCESGSDALRIVANGSAAHIEPPLHPSLDFFGLTIHPIGGKFSAFLL